VSLKVIEVLNQAIQSAGGPPNLITSIASPSLETSITLMKHPKVKLLAVTGGPGVVKQAMSSGKKVIAAGPGNPPVLVDETADISKAARDIVFGASFDNNIMCIAEKEVFVVEKILRNLKEQMQLQGAFELNKFQLERLTKLIFKDYESTTCGDPIMNRDYIGKSPQTIAKAIDLNLPINTCLLMAEVDFEHPLVSSEQLMPILPIVSVKDVNQGIELAVLAEQGFLHTAVMHSRNIENLSKMAYQIKTTIFVKNAPSLAGLGYGGEGFTSLTIAGPTGEGITSARSFTRIRRCVLADYFRII
ncbi:MAG: aldehyde dehydrogenase, partial [Armatimonadetes bacterium]|nr:aldehyde dehydrogenase [Armatimonadota bacterium]